MSKVSLKFGMGFSVVAGNSQSQAATMVIEPGEKEGGAENNHRGADQWLLIVSGKGSATIDGEKIPLAKDDLLLIERGQKHEIRNVGKTKLITLNFYVPPAYTSKGDERPAAKPK